MGVRYNLIFIIIDRLTKYMYMIFYIKSSMTENLTYIFLRIIVAEYNILKKIISDRDKFFIFKFWVAFMVLLGVKRKLSTSFRAQTDGQTN
jgi:hypothetical protein